MLRWSVLWRQALGVSWEHRGLADVVETQVEHDHSLQADATTSVRRTAVSERVDVGSNGVNVDAVVLGSLDQHFGLMDTLSSREDLFSTNENIVRVGEFLALR